MVSQIFKIYHKNRKIKEITKVRWIDWSLQDLNTDWDWTDERNGIKFFHQIYHHIKVIMCLLYRFPLLLYSERTRKTTKDEYSNYVLNSVVIIVQYGQVFELYNFLPSNSLWTTTPTGHSFLILCHYTVCDELTSSMSLVGVLGWQHEAVRRENANKCF